MSLIDTAMNRARPVLACLVLILLAGSYAFLKIPKESSPDIAIPIIYVSMTHSGISPEDAERLLIRPMEQELKGIEGVKEMRSTAYEGGANVLLEFDAGFDAAKAKADVSDKVDVAKTDLPTETDEPSVNEVNLSLFPIITIVLSGEMPERALVKLARDLRDQVEGIPAVLEVDIGGDREERVEIVIDPVQVENHGLATQDVLTLVARSNKLVAAGALDTGQGRFSIKVPGLYRNALDILSQPISASGEAAVTLADFASIRRTFKDPEGFARANGKQAVTLEVKKRVGENVIDTVERVRAVVAREQALWPPGVSAAFTQDQSEQIAQMVFDLENSVIAAILLVMVVVVASLGLRSGLLVGLAIPGSFLLAILVIYAMGLTINVVVLFGLILAVGMLVDGAIVITEYADRKMNEGIDRREAYALAAKRMAWPVIASTATTLAAFLPLLFWTGVVGEFMKYLPITLVATLSASLLMALIFVPVLGRYIGKPESGDEETLKALAASEHGELTALKGITGFYARSLSLALAHPIKVVLASVVLLVAAQALYAVAGRGVEFFPYVEPDQAQVKVHARGNLSIQEKDTLVREVEELVLLVPGIKMAYSRTFNRAPQDAAEDLIGIIGLSYTDWRARKPSKEILQDIRERTAHLAGIQVEPAELEDGPSQGKPVQLRVASRDADKLAPAVEHLLRGLETVGGFVDVEDSRPIPGIEWRLSVDRAEAAKFGADVSAVGNVVQMVTSGLKLSSYRPDDADGEVDIVARFPPEYRGVEQLDRLRLPAAGGGDVPISVFVKRSAEQKISEIRRVDQSRVLTVQANVAEGLLVNDQVTALKAWVAANPLDQSVDLVFKGEDEEQRKSESFLVVAFAVALFVMALILLTQFNSFYSVALILTAVIMSTIGVMLGLLLFDQPFGIIMSGVGVISLAGIVVNNNIVLIDTFDRLKLEHTDQREAILRTGVQRLRPVLLTTITTGLGLLPMVYMLNIDFIGREVSIGAPSMMWWSQLAIAVSAGLAFATVLTLVVTPSLLMIRANLQAWKARRRAKGEALPASP
ncbi:MAG: efflux RND transporter permease subunit [Rhodospirillum sp.]|nr:efflux RND transporter permease subunit [Rhodospirillum sp.]MCF8491862.1 efflux RND transporter permease subunit [Rhodospirillum sp.]MCF8501137.1 efflux RND transporter permease subunit [Rhodospirillum sp.]